MTSVRPLTDPAPVADDEIRLGAVLDMARPTRPQLSAGGGNCGPEHVERARTGQVRGSRQERVVDAHLLIV